MNKLRWKKSVDMFMRMFAVSFSLAIGKRAVVYDVNGGDNHACHRSALLRGNIN
ncbi:hypothetical protein NQX30_04415 [Candidatus Persebacteraceae bacterium Df01]|jgi:hypothetical protein|uniref:Secreted protein n=1 Tax=Candidatus Doriopsillibacter californiensis TaxID=2970740 RepID=A0ABT7QLL4_9GAMM|nr:hypothetical protein [Candidatus Persebacteraceae bacterium Df01]